MDALLGILRKSHPELPKSARALLKTKRNVNSMKKSNMDYYFIGLESGIIDVLKRLPEDVVNSMDDIQFALNIDGLPLFKRTKVALWPILCAILNFERPLVFPVALSCGTSKPADLDFIDDTICLGVMKRLLLTWMYGKLEVRISAQNIITISDRLLHLKPSIRTDIFQRKPRSLLEVKFWKATELRQFLLYTGPVVLKDILRDDVFRHFLCLSVGIRILATPASSQEQIDYAEQLLIYFVKEARNIYGPEMLVYNIHSLVDICNDVRMHGHLDGYSGFAFENYMQQLKSMVRSARFPLSQRVKRLSEDKNSIAYTYKELKFKKSDCFIDNNKCYEIIGSLSGESNTITCKTYIGLDSLFKNPCDSRLVQIYRINRHRSFLKDVHISKLSKRVVMFPIDNTAAALMTLIHGSS
ncbi:uncharacterized protein LOC141913852 [Tubulanus polymorphus]|uniref:uncharacterized protein LOC141913852 n=1 Tax=Tubulanus polymorphus TaxID=672921 RepID=UPI003DA538D8